jgi:hypothetical protein
VSAVGSSRLMAASAGIPPMASTRPPWLDITPPCRGLTHLYFPDGDTDGIWRYGHRGTRNDPYFQARAICDTCPILDPCRDWVTDHYTQHRLGMIGGETPFERKERRRRLGLPVAGPAPRTYIRRQTA